MLGIRRIFPKFPPTFPKFLPNFCRLFAELGVTWDPNGYVPKSELKSPCTCFPIFQIRFSIKFFVVFSAKLSGHRFFSNFHGGGHSQQNTFKTKNTGVLLAANKLPQKFPPKFPPKFHLFFHRNVNTQWYPR